MLGVECGITGASAGGDVAQQQARGLTTASRRPETAPPPVEADLGGTIALFTEILTQAPSPETQAEVKKIMDANGLFEGPRSLTTNLDKVPAVHKALTMLAAQLGVVAS